MKQNAKVKRGKEIEFFRGQNRFSKCVKDYRKLRSRGDIIAMFLPPPENINKSSAYIEFSQFSGQKHSGEGGNTDEATA